MNASQKRQIKDAAILIMKARDVIQEIKDDEEEKLENLSEAAADGDKGTKLQEGIDALEVAIDVMDGLNDDLNELTNT